MDVEVKPFIFSGGETKRDAFVGASVGERSVAPEPIAKKGFMETVKGFFGGKKSVQPQEPEIPVPYKVEPAPTTETSNNERQESSISSPDDSRGVGLAYGGMRRGELESLISKTLKTQLPPRTVSDEEKDSKNSSLAETTQSE
ncbi:MAG: hypothetical protein Q7R49_05735 [Candidatus Daviesbacteria bacterium]|nr:hypothetical protein [Candidatus Daviesbacteria bacterium]